MSGRQTALRQLLLRHYKACTQQQLAALCGNQPDCSTRAGDLVVVSPDVGGVARARAFAKKLNDAPLAIVDKRRSAHNVSEVMNLIGDVDGKVAVLVDDMIDTAGAAAAPCETVGWRVSLRILCPFSVRGRRHLHRLKWVIHALHSCPHYSNMAQGLPAERRHDHQRSQGAPKRRGSGGVRLRLARRLLPACHPAAELWRLF